MNRSFDSSGLRRSGGFQWRGAFEKRTVPIFISTSVLLALQSNLKQSCTFDTNFASTPFCIITSIFTPRSAVITQKTIDYRIICTALPLVCTVVQTNLAIWPIRQRYKNIFISGVLLTMTIFRLKMERKLKGHIARFVCTTVLLCTSNSRIFKGMNRE